jgi:hypothetical protein
MAATNPRIYLSGRFSTGTKIESAWLKRTGCKYRCFSFANLDPKCANFSNNCVEALEVCEKRKIGIMMDSGAFSFHKLAAQTRRRSKISDSKKDIDLEKLQSRMYRWYRDYCLENAGKWDFYITLDYKAHQPTIYAMHKRFIKDGLNPVPVYHGDMDVDWLKRYKDDFGSKFDRVFEAAAKYDLQIHGLAVTSLSLITAYPWFSVDSSTWTQSSIRGMITFPDRDKNTIYNLHISERHAKSPVASYNSLPRRQRSMIEATIKDFGFTLKELRDSKLGLEGRSAWNGKIFSGVFDLIDTTKTRHTEWERLI